MKSKIESKVTVASFAAALSSVILWAVLNYVPSLEEMNEPLAVIVSFIVAGGITFASGYMTKHTKRNDLAPSSPESDAGETG